MCEIQVAYSSLPYRDRNIEERHDKSREKETCGLDSVRERLREESRVEKENTQKHAAFVVELIHASGNNKAETS